MKNACALLAAKRLELISGRGLALTSPENEADLGMTWAWKVLYNAQSHLEERPNYQRTDFQLFFPYQEEKECITNESSPLTAKS